MYDLQYTFVFISSPVPEDFPFSLGLGIGFYGGCEDDPYFAMGLLALRELSGLDKAMSYLLFDKQRCVSTAKEQILQYLQNGEG